MRRSNLPARFWLLTVAAVLSMVLTASLGFWQLSRAAQKLALQAQIDERPKLAALEARALAQTSPGEDILYRSAVLRGTWLGGHTVFLDNRQMYGKPGFFVLTPLQLQNSATAVVVQRGWVPRNFLDRTQMPALPPLPGGVVEVAGRIAPPPSKLYEFQDAGTSAIRQNLDLAGYAKEVGVPLAPVSLQQLGPPADGLARDWPAVNTGIATHYGYAFQWFALCGLIAILYGWFQIVRRFFLPPR